MGNKEEEDAPSSKSESDDSELDTAPLQERRSKGSTGGKINVTGGKINCGGQQAQYQAHSRKMSTQKTKGCYLGPRRTSPGRIMKD